MSHLMFDWLSTHMIISRPSLALKPASGDRGQYSEDKLIVKIDRMHCERTLYLQDGSLVILQILQGILEGRCYDVM